MESGDFRYRLATVTDAGEIALMSRALIERDLEWTWTLPRVARNIRSRDCSSVVACDDASIVGFAIMFFGDEDAHLNLLAVKTEHQRRAVGRRLFEWLRESALTAGIAQIHLELRVTNTGARDFYTALGFTASGYIPSYYGGRETALRMMLRLRQRAISA